MYCEKCSVLFEGDRCPVCGGRKIRKENGEDICLLTERGQIESDLLSEVLEQNRIPFLKKGRRGAALTMMAGSMLESFRFYVACSDFEAAHTLEQELFEGIPVYDNDSADVESDGDEEE